MRQWAKRVADSSGFEYFIVALILINAVILGLETSTSITASYESILVWGNRLILAVFVVEAIIKIVAVAPRFQLYFGNGWNLFDFSVIVLSLVPATGQFAMIARLARLLRVFRLITVIPELRLIVATLIKSIPSMGNIMLLISVIFYMYAVAGFHFFHEHDPTHWESLPISLLTLFRVLTLEDWTDVMYTAMEMNPYSWIYFVTFVIICTFVVINLFIAVVLNNLDEAKNERLLQMIAPVSKEELIKELRATQETLTRLSKSLEKHGP
ncbi:MAG: ion transporter [Gammaproteobacteria bacterium]|nr:ion transporter [Gammaproteobacteria bacterium]PCH62372.1 MAG: ion transporter [Gammaproteobacteria bacterium]